MRTRIGKIHPEEETTEMEIKYSVTNNS